MLAQAQPASKGWDEAILAPATPAILSRVQSEGVSLSPGSTPEKVLYLNS